MLQNKFLLITAGDPGGIGYEIVLKSLPKIKSFIPIVFGQKFVLNQHIKKYNFSLKPLFINPSVLLDAYSITLPMPNFLCVNVCDDELDIKNIDKKNGFYSIKTIDIALETIKIFMNNGIKFSLLTMPVSKNNISKYLNKNFDGHTEYLAKKFSVENFSMLMIGKNFPCNYYVLILTRHIPIESISKNLKTSNIVQQIFQTVKFVETKLNFKNTEILICGLNPHLGEKGKIGKEEITVLKHAVESLNKKLRNNKIIFPILTEQAFNYAKSKKNVLIVTMYHDQAMVPLKLLCGNEIANITVGLPFVRLSPGHGTGFDISGRNIADIKPTLFCINLIKDIFKKEF